MKTPTRPFRRWLVPALFALSLQACAEGSRHSVSLPASYKSECGSCHTAFPPAGLAANDWRQVMAKLDKHFGDNASLDAAQRKEIEDFLVTNAGTSPAKVSPGETARLTNAAWFGRKHHELSGAVWKDPRIKSAANCAACHPKANDGRYHEHEIRMPAGMKSED